jgi:hypothetical protein
VLLENARLSEKRKQPRVVRITAQAVISCPRVRQLLRVRGRQERALRLFAWDVALGRPVSIVGVSGLEHSRVKDGVAWRIGTDDTVAWIRAGAAPGLAVAAAIPPVFADYATLVHPGELDVPRDLSDDGRQDRALLALLQGHAPLQPWWLGCLETGASDIVFWDAPRVELYVGWKYVLVLGGPQQAASWRPADGHRNWKSTELPDLMFPEDRSWLISTLWDDDWTCIGGPEGLIADLLREPTLSSRARRVSADQDATPPGSPRDVNDRRRPVSGPPPVPQPLRARRLAPCRWEGSAHRGRQDRPDPLPKSREAGG